MIDEIITELTRFKITNNLEVAHFLAQAAHESADFTKLEEGTKYRFIRAKVIWPKYKEVIENKRVELKLHDENFVPQPWLFNLVYGNRMGNNAYSDDGYNFRGAGIFQLTGRSNYQLFTNWLNDEVHNIANIRNYCVTIEGAILSAIWFWLYNKVGTKALKDDIVAVTKIINGGTIGLDDRKTKLIKYKKLLGVT